jgi:hypothetical protein
LLLLLLYLWSWVSELFTWSQICLHNSDLLLHFQKWLGLLIIIDHHSFCTNNWSSAILSCQLEDHVALQS